MLNIILFGPPGCGKGTQAQFLQDKLSMYQLSTGDLVRAEISSGSDVAKQIKDIVDAGGLPGDDIIISLMENKLNELIDSGKSIIFDGFPRTVNQAEQLEKMLNIKNKNITHVIRLKVDDDVILKRLSGRFQCASCGEGYNDYFKPTKINDICDKCGHKEFKRRSDDNLESAANRLSQYREQTAPLIEYYRSKGVLSELDGSRAISDVTVEIETIISPTNKVGAI